LLFFGRRIALFSASVCFLRFLPFLLSCFLALPAPTLLCVLQAVVGSGFAWLIGLLSHGEFAPPFPMFPNIGQKGGGGVTQTWPNQT